MRTIAQQLHTFQPNNSSYFYQLYWVTHEKLFDFETAYALNRD